MIATTLYNTLDLIKETNDGFKILFQVDENKYAEFSYLPSEYYPELEDKITCSWYTNPDESPIVVNTVDSTKRVMKGLFKPLKLHRTVFNEDGSVAKKYSVNIRYESDLFIEILRATGEHAILTIRTKENGKVEYTDYHYFNGKLVRCDIDLENKEVVQIGYDLYSLVKVYPSFRVTYMFIDRIPCITQSYAKYTDKNKEIAEILGYDFKCYKNNYLYKEVLNA